MGFFEVDHNKAVWEGIPVDEREPVRFAWLKALIAPAKYVYNLFVANRNKNLYEVGHNGQVFSLENVLNDVFDPISRGIYITDGVFADAVYIFVDIEEKPVYIATVGELPVTGYDAPQFLFTDMETGSMGFQFIIHVPTGVEALPIYDVLRVRGLVEKYRLPSKTLYTLVYY